MNIDRERPGSQETSLPIRYGLISYPLRIEHLAENEREMLRERKGGGYSFEYARTDDILDNIGCYVEDNGEPLNLSLYTRSLVGEINGARAEFAELTCGKPLQDARVVGIGNKEVRIYSYKDNAEDEIKRVADALSILPSRTPLASLYMPANIVLVDGGRNRNDGQPANAHTSLMLGTTVLFSRAFNGEAHDLPGVGKIDALMAHEWHHLFMGSGFTRALEEWMEIGKWRETLEGEPIIDNLGFQTDAPEECVTLYARAVAPQEDFGESGAAAILLPEHLMQKSMGKYKFMRSFLQLNDNPPERTAYVMRSLDTSQPPQFPTRFRYSLAQLPEGMRISNKNPNPL